MKTEKDLIWLVRGTVNEFPILAEETPKDVIVIVDILAETWTFRGQTTEFGRAVEYPWTGGGTPLGVYDKTNLDHLQRMLIDYRRLAPPISVSGS